MSTSTRSTDRVAIGPCWALLLGILLGPAAGAAVRSDEDIRPPDVSLTDSTGREVRLVELLAVDEPVLVQFVFTTCPGICPILAATFRSVRERLEPGGEASKVRMLSISIDPEHDTPRVLADFAATFGAGKGSSDWLFLTGGHDDIVEVQKAFGAYRDDKMSHEPLIFLRRGRNTHWTRFAGFASADELASAVQSPPSGPPSPGGES